MTIRAAHRLIRSFALVAMVGGAVGMGPAPAATGSSETGDGACLVERAYTGVRDSITGAIDSAKDTAHASYGIDCCVIREDGSHEWVALGEAGALPARGVVLIHGLDEYGTIWSDLAPEIHGQGHAVFRFRYPNDANVAPNADLFASWLMDLRANGVDCVDIVCHSMGGLVSYELLTREGLYGGNGTGHDDLPTVRRLITVGTPWHGSPLAPLRGVMEAREQAIYLFNGEGSFTDRALRFLADGTGEAGKDLKPGSDFLSELIGRPLPANVRITTIVGRVETDELRAWRDDLTEGFLADVFGKRRIESLLKGADAVSATLGDGAVPGHSAVLEGVEDVVYLQADHRSLIKELDAPGFVRDAIGCPDSPPAIPVILSRLNEQCGCGGE
ncbi:MAG: hypothetical protein RLN60_01595 [Phycisphaerales bacterium]